MKVTIEHSFCPYSEEVTDLYFRIINTILFSTDEAELRESMRQLEEKTPLHEYFTYGYGAHHLWVCQRRPSDKTLVFKHRIMLVEFNQPTDIGYRLEWNYPFQPCRPSFYNFSFGCAVSFFTAVHSCEKHPAFLSDPVSAFPYGHFSLPLFWCGYSSHPQLCVLSLLHSDWNDPLRQYTLNECRSVLLPRQATLESLVSPFFVAVREGASIPAPESGHELLPAVPSIWFSFSSLLFQRSHHHFPLQR